MLCDDVMMQSVHCDCVMNKRPLCRPFRIGPMQMYTEPEWSTPTASAGHFEVFKSGATAQVVPIAAGTKLMRFGRLPDNDIVLDHESVSRGHAIVQFGPGNGAFLYDLGSTHGTFLNKKRIPAQKYVKLNQANDQIQLGGSTRVFVLNLEEEFASKPDEKATPNLRQRVLDFFEENDVDPKCISVSSHDDTVTCTLNYSDFVHVGSQDNPAVSASGANRELALQAFFEASHEFLLRAGLLQPVDRSASDSDSGEDTEGEFFVADSVRRKRAAGKEEVLSEKDVSRLKIQHEAELNALSLEISEIEEQISQCAVETECEIDAYLREVRREDLKRDLEKRHVAREQAQQVRASVWRSGVSNVPTRMFTSTATS